MAAIINSALTFLQGRADRRLFAPVNDLNLEMHQAQIGQFCSVLPED